VRNTASCIANLNFDGVIHKTGLDINVAIFFYCLSRIDQQIQKYLVQLHRVTQEIRKVSIGRIYSRLVFQLTVHNIEGRFNSLVYVGLFQIGFINSVSEPFCADCNRIRLTADGKLRTCLFSVHETDLRGPLRGEADDAELERIVRDAVWRKELKHHINEPGFRQPARTMSAIGG